MRPCQGRDRGFESPRARPSGVTPPRQRGGVDLKAYSGQRLSPALLLPVVLAVACFVVALVPRLAGLESYLTSDEGYWMQRTLRFGAALARGDLNATYRSGHPGVTVTWVGLLGVGPERLSSYLPSR